MLLPETVTPEKVANHFGFALDGQLGELQDHYLFRAPKNQHTDLVNDAIRELRERRRRKRSANWEPHIVDGVLLNQKQELRQRLYKRESLPVYFPSLQGYTGKLYKDEQPPPVDSAVQKGLDIAKSLGIADPIFQDQWHLYNHIQVNNDINVTGVWQQGITGKDSTVCIIDDGLDLDSNDLKANYFAEGSYDFNDQVDDPKPRLSDDRHGTRCAGEVSAVKNDVCGVGVAYDSKIAGIRILSQPISDADEAIAMNYAYNKTQIYSCSWGPMDDGIAMEEPGILIRRAMVNAVQNGRQGLGSIYVFAAGNGAAKDDNCNFDGYTNMSLSAALGATTNTLIIQRSVPRSWWLLTGEQYCGTFEQDSANIHGSSGAGDAIHTTDVGENKCYDHHGGTSAAGPLVAGAYALVLDVRPDLTWRDIQWLTVMTALPLDQPSDWQDTTIGKRFSHQFGYGKLDTWALVEAAKDWTKVKPQAWYFSPWLHVKHTIPQGDQGLASNFEVTGPMLEKANLEKIEHITVTMNVDHTRRGDLSVELHSPSGIVSHLATTRRNDDTVAGYVDWTFMSVAHWGEAGIGTWTVIVKDTNVNENNGSWTDWHLKLFGECIRPADQPLLPLPTEHDDDDHNAETTSAAVSTTTVAVPTETGEVPGNPTDHIDRPVNNKVSSSTSAPTSMPAPAPTSSVAMSTTVPAPTSTPTDLPETFLPSPFPTFGVSKRTQIWIYGSIALIGIFVTSLAAYFFMARRRRLRNARDDYEFEMLNEDDADDRRPENGRAVGRKKRAGELYDAFAEGSDEELFSDGDDGSAYRDHDLHEDGSHERGVQR
ncbi:pheromone processing endoprotease [Elasticomyces elasticus]|nr:pheromone processing endoprotease [Elasticomyces elasticus]